MQTVKFIANSTTVKSVLSQIKLITLIVILLKVITITEEVGQREAQRQLMV